VLATIISSYNFLEVEISVQNGSNILLLQHPSLQTYKNQPRCKIRSPTCLGKGADTTPEPGTDITKILENASSFAIQIVRQFNYGPLDFKRYFTEGEGINAFVELTEKTLIDANFEKLNS
jgi:hypothetical protein